MSGFVYIWFDRKHRRFYVGSHWGLEDDGYVCSSQWMKRSHERRPQDFRRRIISRVMTSHKDLLIEESRWLRMIRKEEMKPRAKKPRYYNLRNSAWELWHADPEKNLTVGQKISKAKTGRNTGPRDPEVGRRISEAKKASFARRREELGYAMSPEHREKVNAAHKGRKHTEEWKAAQSERLRKQWATGVRG